MSLISCTECGKEVSNQAKMCPHCGCPIKKKGKGFAIASLILGVLSCFYTYTFCMSILISKLSLAVQPEITAEEASVMEMGILPAIITVSLLAIIFGFVSYKKGGRFKKNLAGIIMGSVSILISIILAIIF